MFVYLRCWFCAEWLISIIRHFFFQYCDLYLVSLDPIVHLSYTIVLKMVVCNVYLFRLLILCRTGDEHYSAFFFLSILWSVSSKSRFDCTSIIHNSTQNGPYQHCAASTCTTNWSIIFWNANINHWPNFGCDHHFYYWFRSIYTRRLDCRKNEFRFVENVPFGNTCTQNKSILWTFCHTAFIYLARVS